MGVTPEGIEERFEEEVVGEGVRAGVEAAQGEADAVVKGVPEVEGLDGLADEAGAGVEREGGGKGVGGGELALAGE